MTIASRLFIPNALVVEGQVFQDRLDATIEELCSQEKGVPLPLGDYGTIPAKVSEGHPAEAERRYAKLRHMQHFRVLLFTAELATPTWRYNESNEIISFDS